jgi:hypothetical protein
MSNLWGVGAPRTADLYLVQIAKLMNAELLRREAVLLGWRHDGVTLHLRLRASAATPWVQVHVQAFNTDGSAYNAASFRSSTEVDCRLTRVQDVTITDLPADRHVVYLIPVQYDGAGAKVLYDGVGGNPDNMTFTDIGV